MRLEYKFLLRENQLPEFRQSILPYVIYDNYAADRPNKEYTVRSIYFDTHNFKFYHEKIEGIKVRKKLRVRCYNEKTTNPALFLEIKMKNENFIAKHRALLAQNDLKAFLSSANLDQYFQGIDDVERNIRDAKQFIRNYKSLSLVPTALVTYDREPFFSKFNSALRITIDKKLRCLIFPTLDDLYEEDKLKRILKNYCIIEIKFWKGYPHWLQEIVRDFRLSRQALSKYTMSIDSEKDVHRLFRKTAIARVERYLY